MADFKKLTWVKHDWKHKDEIWFSANIPYFNRCIRIQNWSKMKYDKWGDSEPICMKDKFYVAMEKPDGQGYTRKVECNSLEEAKQLGQDLFIKLIMDCFCEKPLKRIVLVEKCKRKPRKKASKQDDMEKIRDVIRGMTDFDLPKGWNPKGKFRF